MTEIFGDDEQRVATYRDLNEMKYLERVLKESLRIYPSVPNISRKVNEDIIIGRQKFQADLESRDKILCENSSCFHSANKGEKFSFFSFPST